MNGFDPACSTCISVLKEVEAANDRERGAHGRIEEVLIVHRWGAIGFVRRQAGVEVSYHWGKRCWTLDYPREPFHIDVLPALPDDCAPPNGIVLTDRDLLRWQVSNPIDYATWFHSRIPRRRAGPDYSHVARRVR